MCVNWLRRLVQVTIQSASQVSPVQLLLCHVDTTLAREQAVHKILNIVFGVCTRRGKLR